MSRESRENALRWFSVIVWVAMATWIVLVVLFSVAAIFHIDEDAEAEIPTCKCEQRGDVLLCDSICSPIGATLTKRKPRDKHCFEINCKQDDKASCTRCISSMTCYGDTWGSHCSGNCTRECHTTCDLFCVKGRLKKAERK